MDKFHFSIEETPILTVFKRPVKSLGKVFNSSLKDTASGQATQRAG